MTISLKKKKTKGVVSIRQDVDGYKHRLRKAIDTNFKI